MSWRRLRLVLLLTVLLVLAWVGWRRAQWMLAMEESGRGERAAAARGRESRPATDAPVAIQLTRVAEGLERPLFVTHAGDGSGRLFVVEQGGRVRVMKGGQLQPEPFLDLAAALDTDGGERGLLGLAFPPDFARSRRFVVAHTAPGPLGRVAWVSLTADGQRGDAASETPILDMEDPAGNHNGGMVAFGPDGHLWIGTGDGGSGGDPWDNAENRDVLLGKLLRLDVGTSAGGRPYAIPADNPFARGGGRPEVWALGLRNPWRFSFDRQTGELWIGDVGQNAWEEIDVADPRRDAGADFGWNTMEGLHCFQPPGGCDGDDFVLPIHEYGHGDGCSVTGGYVYRGTAIPALQGTYLFSDYCTGTLWGLRRDGAGKATVSVLATTELRVSSFGEDEAGEVYVVDHGGAVYRLDPSAP